MTSRDLLDKAPDAMGELWRLCYHGETKAIRKAAACVDAASSKHRAVLLLLHGCGNLDLVLGKYKAARQEIDKALAELDAVTHREGASCH